MHQNDQQVLVFLICVVVLIAVLARRRWRPSTTAFGTASWASENVLKAAGMLGNVGLILGRTMSGKLIRVANYCHVLLVGATGAGKGVSIIIPNLLSYFRGFGGVFRHQGRFARDVLQTPRGEGQAHHPAGPLQQQQG